MGAEPTIARLKSSSARAGHSITESFFSLHRPGQRILAGGNRLRSRVLDLVGLIRVELDVFREFWRKVCVGVNGVHGAYLYTFGELASVAFIGHDVRHGI